MGQWVQKPGFKSVNPSDIGVRFARAERVFPKDLESKVFDFCVVGGAINGSSTARDLALRGFSVAVIDKYNPRKPSNTSSRMAHPGVRYLQHMEFGLVLESIKEIRNWFRIAPHLVQPLSMIIPAYKGDNPPRWQLKIGMLLYDTFAWIAGLPRHQSMSKAQLLKKVPTLANPDKLQGGFNYTDGQATYVERISIENLRDAQNHGAQLLKHSEVTALEENPENVSLTVTDQFSGKIRQIKAKYVVNATGPWVDQLLQKTQSPYIPKAPQMGPTKGTHILVKNTIGLQHAIYRGAKDGRPFFTIPFPIHKPDYLLIGTTDERKETIHPTKDEIQYLLDSVNQAFDGLNLTEKDVFMAYSGFRPLPASDKNTGAVTRKHIIRRIGKGRIFNVIGGKITTARHLAEQVSDQATRALLQETKDPERVRSIKKQAVCRTATTPLPGGRGIQKLGDFKKTHVQSAAKSYDIPEAVVEELINRYGALYSEVLNLTQDNPDLKKPLTHSAPLILAQVLHAIRYENADSLMEILTESLKTDLLPGHGLEGLEAAAEILAQEKQLTPEEKAEEIRAYRQYIDENMAWLVTTPPETLLSS